MDVFDNCRICLEAIIHEPIKMTRFVLSFIEHGLNLKCVVRQFEPKNARLNLCAVCVNKLSDFQDFYEQLKESDEFWSSQFSSDKQKKDEESMREIEEEDQNQADEIRSIVCSPTNRQCQEVFAEFKEPDSLVQTTPMYIKVVNALHGAGKTEEPEENENIVHFEDFVQWPVNIQVNEVEPEDTNYETQQDVDQEYIEYEYELEECNNDKVETSQLEAPSSTVVETECNSINNECESQDMDECESQDMVESKSCDVSMQETFEDVLGTEEQLLEECKRDPRNKTTKNDKSGKAKKIYQCQHCDRTFDRIYDIESHNNIHSDTKPFLCNVCGRSFRQKNILTTHQTLHYGKKVECNECGKKFSRKSQLILHSRMHRNEKPFVCDFDGCESAFRQRQHLLDHLYIHTGEKKFPCSSCNKTFQTRKRLQDHLYKVHSTHRYGCHMCTRSFLKPHQLKTHLLNVHQCEISDVSHLKVLVDRLNKKTTKKASGSVKK